VVVLLSSVAKAPPATTPPAINNLPVGAPAEVPTRPSDAVRTPPPLPVRAKSPQGKLPSPVILPESKLPPTTVQSEGLLGSDAPSPLTALAKAPPPTERPGPVKPPPLPAKVQSRKAPEPARSEPKKATARMIPPIKLNQPPLDTGSPQESIFVDIDGNELERPPEGWKQLEPGDLTEWVGDLQTLEVFSSTPSPAPTPAIPVVSAKVAEKSPTPEKPPEAAPVAVVEAKVPVAANEKAVSPAPIPPTQVMVILPPVVPVEAEAKPFVLASPTVLSEPAPVMAPPAMVILPPVAPVEAEAKPFVLTPPTVLSEPAPVVAAPAMVILPPIVPVETEAKPFVLAPASLLSVPIAPEPVVESSKTFHAPPPVSAKAGESPAAHGLHAAPRLLGTEPAAPPEKLLPPPVLPSGHQEEMTSIIVAKPAVSTETAQGLSPVPAPSTSTPVSKLTGPITVLRKEKTTSSTAPSSAKKAELSPKIEVKAKLPNPITGSPSIKVEENKPALRPAVLPNKLLTKPVEPVVTTPLVVQAKATEPVVAPKPLETAPPVKTAEPLPAAKKGKASEVAPPARKEEKGRKLFGFYRRLKPPVEPAPIPVTPAPDAPPTVPSKAPPLPLTRAARAKRRRIVDAVIFYVIMLLSGVGLYFGGIYFSRQTRIEGQVIPPAGMPLNNEVWIVSDFRPLTSGIAEDLALERSPLLEAIQERQDHVQRAQADIALREERIRLLQGQIQAAKDEAESIVKQAREATQKLWDGPGAAMDAEYDARLDDFQSAVAARAKKLKLNYQPDDSYRSPEVWANAYRLALYQVPPGVDSAKEHEWLNALLKGWRDFLLTLDTRKEQLREQAAQIKLAPASRLTDINAKIDELDHRIDVTQTEEEPIKAELQQAQSDLAQAQTSEAGLDDKYYKQLDVLPGENIVKHIPLLSNGRFTWIEDTPFAEGENEHHYWIFSRAVRADGREYWSLVHFTVTKDSTLAIIIDPGSFVSTKAILRPDLSPDEQEQ
jgi:hypothetical protein